MSAELTLKHIILALSGASSTGSEERALVSSPQVSEVIVDSRRTTKGSVFVALRGETTDGHLYVQDAFDRGAIAAIVEKAPTDIPVLDLREPRDAGLIDVSSPVCLLVEDSLAALQQVATWWRQRFQVRIVGITGSIGKTTTKEFVASVLAQRYCVLKSEGNYNNEIGLPLTLLQLNSRHERVVLEMGTYGPGEITLLAEIARPQVGIVTNVGPVHLERMGTIERIAQSKAELPQALPVDGVVILNGDDEWVRSMAQKTTARVFFYGLSPNCDLRADEVDSRGLEGVRFRFHYRGQAVHVHIPLLGRHSVHTALRAAAVGLVEGLSWDEILHGLRAGEQLRLVVVPGANGSTLLDDTYNSSPDSAIAALNLLNEFQGHKIAVMGDMLELGGYAVEGHCRVGRRAIDVVSKLITVGELGKLIGQGALDYGMSQERVIQLPDNDAAIVCLQDLLQEGDVVLIKGSRGMMMERIVEALARPPANGIGADQNGGN
jgi:UDP-N-acetylmuramoyl-tripeptide--D-alanyl-D-alanine ligase